MTTTKDIRLANLLLLKQELGSLSAVAKATDTSASYLSQILTGVKSSTGTARGVGDSLARKIETGCEKPVGWMDVEHRARRMDPMSHYLEGAYASTGLHALPVLTPDQAVAARTRARPYSPSEGYAVELTDERMSEWAFAIDIADMSMTPIFQPGDRIFVEPSLKPEPGDLVVAVSDRDGVTMKKYRPRGVAPGGDIIFELTPLNDDYATLRSDSEFITLLGVVTEHHRKLKKR